MPFSADVPQTAVERTGLVPALIGFSQDAMSWGPPHPMASWLIGSLVLSSVGPGVLFVVLFPTGILL